jgi:hypothetical protein
MLSIEFSEENWERPITELMLKGKTSLERLIEGTGNQAALPSIRPKHVSNCGSQLADFTDSCSHLLSVQISGRVGKSDH